MSFLSLILTVGFIGSGALSWRFFKRFSHLNRMDRILRALMPLSVYILAMLFAKKFLDVPTFWHTSFLADLFALSKGYPLYQGPHLTAPLLSSIYPPMGYLSYFPVLLAQTPTFAVMMGRVLAVIYYFAPVGLLYFKKREDPGTDTSIYGFIVFSLMTFYSLPLIEVAFAVNVDAPALGFGALACAFLYLRKSEKDVRALLLSALFVVFAVWSKQVMAPLFLALPFYLLLAEDLTTFKKYVLFLFSVGLLISGAFFILFDPSNLLFHILYVPGHHPWIDPSPFRALAMAAKGLLEYAAVPLSLSFIGVFLSLLDEKEGHFHLRPWLKRNKWALFFVVGLFMAPLSILGKVKEGGAHNTFSYSLYFLSLSGSLGLAMGDQSYRKALLAAMIFSLVALKTPALVNFNDRPNEFYPNHASQAYHYLKLHPDSAYFPYDPLSSLMANGKFNHTWAALEERERAGMPLSQDDFGRVLSFKFDRVIFPPDAKLKTPFSKDPVMKYLPDYDKRISEPELPNWVVYEKS